jgi:hypothetical protein
MVLVSTTLATLVTNLGSADCNDNQINLCGLDAVTTQVACGVTNNTDYNDNLISLC